MVTSRFQGSKLVATNFLRCLSLSEAWRKGVQDMNGLSKQLFGELLDDGRCGGSGPGEGIRRTKFSHCSHVRGHWFVAGD